MAEGDDRREWSSLDAEIHSDWLASLSPWEFVAHLGQADQSAAREWARANAECNFIECDGERLTVNTHESLWFRPDGLNVPVDSSIGSVFVPTPRP